MFKDVENFLINVNENSSMRNEILKLKNKHKNENLSEKNKLSFIINGVLPIAKKYGYNFTIEEYFQINKRRELSQKELENTTGGKKFPSKSLAIASGFAFASLGQIVDSALAKNQKTKNTSNSSSAHQKISSKKNKKTHTENKKIKQNKTSKVKYFDVPNNKKNSAKNKDHKIQLSNLLPQALQKSITKNKTIVQKSKDKKAAVKPSVKKLKIKKDSKNSIKKKHNKMMNKTKKYKKNKNKSTY
ncbi:MAG: hypothetical protein LBT82_02210 [Oscillospiraceae bacterium]|jgi:hypothetical protein|nr:hypothetical protein [Oscillospiraceae bacterium]